MIVIIAVVIIILITTGTARMGFLLLVAVKNAKAKMGLLRKRVVLVLMLFRLISRLRGNNIVGKWK
jgi:hypothetical protein